MRKEMNETTYSKVQIEEIQLRKLELQLSEERLRTDKQIAYFEAWKVDINPRQELHRDSNKNIAEFAQAALKSAFLLNGGALIVLPTLDKVFSGGVGVALITPIAFFVGGLVCCSLATFAAYVSYRHESDRLDNAIAAMMIIVNEKYHPNKHTEHNENEKRRLQAQEKIAGSRVSIWSYVGILVYALSVSCFVLGAVYGFITID